MKRDELERELNKLGFSKMIHKDLFEKILAWHEKQIEPVSKVWKVLNPGLRKTMSKTPLGIAIQKLVEDK